jgi:hypothetical protein
MGWSAAVYKALKAPEIRLFNHRKALRFIKRTYSLHLTPSIARRLQKVRISTIPNQGWMAERLMNDLCARSAFRPSAWKPAPFL